MKKLQSSHITGDQKKAVINLNNINSPSQEIANSGTTQIQTILNSDQTNLRATYRQSQRPQNQFQNKRTFSAISDDSPFNPSYADDTEAVEYETPISDREFNDDTTNDVTDQDT